MRMMFGFFTGACASAAPDEMPSHAPSATTNVAVSFFWIRKVKLLSRFDVAMTGYATFKLRCVSKRQTTARRILHGRDPSHNDGDQTTAVGNVLLRLRPAVSPRLRHWALRQFRSASLKYFVPDTVIVAESPVFVSWY